MPSDQLPPGPRGSSWLGGSLRDFTARRLDFFLDVARDYGPLASFRFGPRRMFLASDPALIEQVLVTDAKHYIKHFGARMYKPVLGNGLVTSEGEFWLRQRRLSQPAFLKQRVHSYAPAMAELTRRMLADWRPGKWVDVQYEFSGLTSAIALKTLFGLESTEDRATFVEALREAFDLMSARFRTVLAVPRWVPTPANRKLKRAIRHLDTVMDGFIAAGKKRAAEREGQGSTAGEAVDLLTRLLAARDEDGSAMTPRQLRDEAMTLYLAGHETTALTLSWAWLLLAQNPAAEDRLVAEWKAVLGGRSPTPDDLPNLPYTDAVIAEAMRVYPPVYLIGREATKELELGGYRVKKGYTIFMSQWVNHRDPAYFPDPGAFKPERWLDGLAKRIPKYAYYPFGGGPRVCIGNTFALMEAAILLATVGQRYRFTLDPAAVIDFDPQITLLPKYGIPATLAAR
ncbi:cytochrome P450 [Urbifossiella limnaea]|uniref:Pentalenene oxygenase n=1 Tax=Urbifossiella limnaea TaxID=2528023 RepID=A0A517XRY9_9BACT|nr:cytochrome P450 [Urbifossiella limnaea]QDU20275.1 Pentalenene oxygenase [Urbifossiella limnaea]